MKKILSLGAAAAVLSLTAVAASAAITPVVDGNAVAGEEVVVTVVANGLETPYATFTLEVENLEQVGDAVVNPIGLYNPANVCLLSQLLLLLLMALSFSPSHTLLPAKLATTSLLL